MTSTEQRRRDKTPPGDRMQENRSQQLEKCALESYHVPGSSSDVSMGHQPQQAVPSDPPLPPAFKAMSWVYNPADGSILRDNQTGKPVSVDRLLATKPLRGELSTRPGPGNKKLTYLSGDGVTRTLNDIFGFDGWNLDILQTNKEDSTKDPKTGKYSVVYASRVRLTHKASGAYREECGTGDSVDRHFGTALGHALKGSITDAMKRAARQFGDKLGNSLYESSFTINKAPKTLKEALDRHDIDRANTKFGFPKDQNYALAKSSPKEAKVTAGTNATLCSNATISAASVNGQQQEQKQPKKSNSDAATETIQPVAWQRNSSGRQYTSKPNSTVVTEHSRVMPNHVPTSRSVNVSKESLSITTKQRPSQCRSNHDPQQQGIIHRCKDPDTTKSKATQIVLPPPTPADSLRQSALFSFDEAQLEQDYEASIRPTSSYGRSSMDGQPISMPPLVTPIVPPHNYSNKVSSAGSSTNKRGPLFHNRTNDTQIISINGSRPSLPPPTKKMMTTNPYGGQAQRDMANFSASSNNVHSMS